MACVKSSMAILIAEPIVRMRNPLFWDVKLGKIFSYSLCSCDFFLVSHFFIVFLVKHLFEKFSYFWSLVLFCWFRSCGTKRNAQDPNFLQVLLPCIHLSGGSIPDLKSWVKKSSCKKQNKLLKPYSVSSSTTQSIAISAKLSFKNVLELLLLAPLREFCTLAFLYSCQLRTSQVLGSAFFGRRTWLHV